MGPSGLVPAWCPFSDLEKIIYRGLAEQVFLAAKEGIRHEDPKKIDWVAIDAERYVRELRELLEEVKKP